MASGHHRLVEFTQANNITISAEDMIQEIKISLESRTLKLLQTASTFVNQIANPEPLSHQVEINKANLCANRLEPTLTKTMNKSGFRGGSKGSFS